MVVGQSAAAEGAAPGGVQSPMVNSTACSPRTTRSLPVQLWPSAVLLPRVFTPLTVTLYRGQVAEDALGLEQTRDFLADHSDVL
jgi:hypothetical protein